MALKTHHTYNGTPQVAGQYHLLARGVAELRRHSALITDGDEQTYRAAAGYDYRAATGAPCSDRGNRAEAVWHRIILCALGE